MIARQRKPLAAIVGGVAVTAAAIVGAVLQGSAADSETFAGDMSTGVTVTASTAPKEAPVSAAVPAIKGPAPLPPEEQGLPG